MKSLISLWLLCFLLMGSASRVTPEPRDHHAMVFDTSRNAVVLFGGNGNGESVTYHNNLWEWDGTQWSKPEKGELEGRSSHAMVYNPSQKKTVLFGGVIPGGLADNSVYLWDGSNWSSLQKGPSARYSPAIAYDEKRKAIILFSGAGKGEDEMWEWRNQQWHEIKLPEDNRPNPRTRSQMAYDHVRETVVLFGGYANGTSVGDMWEWDGIKWSQINVKGPGARNNHTMVSDNHRKRIVLFGGKERSSNQLYGDTWEWDGTSWEKVSDAGPQPRDMTAAVYDQNAKRVLLFGGRDTNRKALGDFWAWDGVKWSKIH